MVGMMTAALLIAVAAVWRLWDGRNHAGRWSERTAVRNVIGITIALASASVGVGLPSYSLFSPSELVETAGIGQFAENANLVGFDWPRLAATIWLAGVAALSLIAGRTDWPDAGYMIVRYGLPAAAAVAPCVYFGVVGYVEAAGYVLACMAAGASYSAFRAIDHRLPVFPSLGIDGWQAYGSFTAGAVVIGGLAVL